MSERHLEDDLIQNARAAAHQFLRDQRVPLGVKMMMADANPLIDAIEAALLREREKYILEIADLKRQLSTVAGQWGRG